MNNNNLHLKSKNKSDILDLPFPAYEITKTLTFERNVWDLLKDANHIFQELGFVRLVYYEDDPKITFQRGDGLAMYSGRPYRFPMIAIVTVESDFQNQTRLRIKYMISTQGNWIVPREIQYYEREIELVFKFLQFEQVDIAELRAFGRRVALENIIYFSATFAFTIALIVIVGLLDRVGIELVKNNWSLLVFCLVAFGTPVFSFAYIIWIGLPFNSTNWYLNIFAPPQIGEQIMLDNFHDKLTQLLSSRPFQYLRHVKSTQDIAFSWLREGAVTGSVVIADEQTKGRGRGKHGWTTPPGTAIAMSVILHPSPETVHQITMLGALAIYDVLILLGAKHEDIGIKWPNDVQLKGKKVCGILPESEWDGEQLKGVVLGIGVNVRVKFVGTPLADIAISLEQALDKTIDRAELIQRLLDEVDYWYERLGTDLLFEAWRDRLVTLGQQVSITSEGETVIGKAESVDSQGALMVRTATGELKRVVAGDVAIR